MTKENKSMELTYNDNTWKISSKSKDEIKNSVKTTVNYLLTFDSIENVVRFQIHDSVNRKYN
jgi:hypothetical protein